jgi:hypothetical protein
MPRNAVQVTGTYRTLNVAAGRAKACELLREATNRLNAFEVRGVHRRRKRFRSVTT